MRASNAERWLLPDVLAEPCHDRSRFWRPFVRFPALDVRRRRLRACGRCRGSAL